MRSRSASPAHPNYTNSSLWLLIFLLILVNLATSLYTLPLNRVIERRLCQEHYRYHNSSATYPKGSIPEKLCKIDEVQRRLAWLQGIMETTMVVCDVIVTIPFSFVAERYGIRVVLWCNLVPRVFLSVVALVVGNFDHIFPTQAIVAGPFLSILGGECVFSSTIFTLTSALAGEYVQRASYFSYISSISYVVAFIGPALASFTMSQSLWLPFWINIALLLSAVPIIRMLPNARKYNIRPSSVSEDDESNETESSRPLLDGPSPQSGLRSDRYANAFDTPNNAFQNMLHTAHALLRLVIGRRNFQILLLSCFLTAVASSDTKLLVQYISKRYEWTFAQAGYMLSAKAFVNIVLLTTFVPRIIRRSVSTNAIHGSEVRLNYIGAEASIAISVVGVLCVALAFKLWMLLAALMFYALGSALPIFVMSMVKSPLIALGHSDSQDFSIVMLTKTLGSLVGAPLMTVLWMQAIRIGGFALGLPYFVSACVYSAAAFVVARLQF